MGGPSGSWGREDSRLGGASGAAPRVNLCRINVFCQRAGGDSAEIGRERRRPRDYNETESAPFFSWRCRMIRSPLPRLLTLAGLAAATCALAAEPTAAGRGRKALLEKAY